MIAFVSLPLPPLTIFIRLLHELYIPGATLLCWMIA